MNVYEGIMCANLVIRISKQYLFDILSRYCECYHLSLYIRIQLNGYRNYSLVRF